MTTFEDSDLFTETFRDFRFVGIARRRPALVGPIALMVAAGLVVVGFVWARGGPLLTDTTVDASTLLPQFASAQKATDRLSSADLRGLGVDADSTRFLTETSTGAHYAAVGTSGSLCVVTVLAGNLPAVSCTAPTATARVTVDETLLVVASTGRDPVEASGWRQAGPDVFVND